MHKNKIPGSNRKEGSSPSTRTKGAYPVGSNPTPSANDLPPDFAELLANAPLTRDTDLDALNRAAAELDRDSEFLADFAKGLVVEDVLRAMEASGLSKNALAEKIGTSRQYLSKILDEDHRVNFTIETLAALASALELQLCVRLLPAKCTGILPQRKLILPTFMMREFIEGIEKAKSEKRKEKKVPCASKKARLPKPKTPKA